MYTIKFEGSFKKDIKKMLKRNADISLLDNVLDLLESGGAKLPDKYKPHKLSGTYFGYWECHIKPDWLLVYKVDENEKVIKLAATGTHADLFK